MRPASRLILQDNTMEVAYVNMSDIFKTSAQGKEKKREDDLLGQLLVAV
jgi:hypothetical protein